MKTQTQPRRLAVYASKALRHEAKLIDEVQEKAAKDGFPSWSEWLRAVCRLYVDGTITMKPVTLEVKKGG